jgi:UDP-glucose 4-epimerase
VRVLLTGGAGFIGSHVADRLVARGDDVLVIDNFATGRRGNLPDHPNLTLVEGTIADRALVDRAFDELRPHVVVHAAASYKDPDDWQEDVLTNVLGTSHVVRASRRLGVRRLVYFQTSLCYGLEPLEQPITLEHPVQPAPNSYAITKTAGERFVALSGVDYVSLRLANAYGPRNVSGPLPTFYRRLTSGRPCFVTDARRDFIYFADVVEVVERAIDGIGRAGPYHVSSGSDRSIRELFDLTVEALGTERRDVEVRPRGPDDAFTILIDPSLTHRDFGWKATTALETGVPAAIDWYRSHPLTETFTHLELSEASTEERA